jgi:hypothetical protein
MNVHIGKILDDNFVNILEKLDIKLFMYFISTCKTFYIKKKEYINDIISNLDTNLYQYNTNANIFNYIDINSENDKNDIINKIEYKIKNAFNICKYDCIFTEKGIQDKFVNISKLYLQLICKKHNYKYFNIIYDKIYYYKWFLININIFEIYELEYHIKMKKYKKIYDTLLSLTFINNQEYIIETIYFLQLYFFNKKNIKYKSMIIYVLYSYVNINLDNLIKNIELINNITIKSTEFIDSILLIKMPKYIKNLIINKINDTVKKINL